ncbi:phage tail protein [Pseudomonas sp. MSSRFD41]|uniref:phage tail protein n=1 Tax=Pseudomonas sp. MSSRFD41 TaxID=1310370 RepID=UPI00163B3192|nr:phage tail protein [Pseudomonas sp. MSSRFD41]MBC2655103.1 phage tail protein [Pseudomonas sp. MSSRFD41]
MDYPKSIPGVGLVDGHFVDENPATGQVGSLIPAAWGDAITQEILNVIKAAGLAPSESNVSQLAAAVQAIAASDVKRSVLVATTGPIALSGLQTIDGVAVPAGARVLVKNQANAAQNWIYVASAGPWTRAQDADDSAKCTPGHLIGVQSGTLNAGALWQLANTAAPVLGTTALTFVLALGKTGVVAGEFRRVIVDAFGRVTGGSNPDTLGGYGITDAVTKSELNSAVANLLPKSGGTVSGSIVLNNGTIDSPEISWQTPGFDIRADVVGKTLRFFSVNDGETTFPLTLDVINKTVQLFGNTAWHSGNLKPQDKADKASTLAGYGINDAFTKTETTGQINQAVKPVSDRVTVLEQRQGFTKQAATPEQVITEGGSLTIPHGLGTWPVLWEAYLVCKEAEHGYWPGAVLSIASSAPDNAYHLGITVVPDQSNLNCKYGTQTGVFFVLDWNTRTTKIITPSKWRVFFRVWA